jgi:hypothetical protein
LDLEVALKNSFVGITLCERRKEEFLFVEKERERERKKRKEKEEESWGAGCGEKWCSCSYKGSTEGWWSVVEGLERGRCGWDKGKGARRRAGRMRDELTRMEEQSPGYWGDVATATRQGPAEPAGLDE